MSPSSQEFCQIEQRIPLNVFFDSLRPTVDFDQWSFVHTEYSHEHIVRRWVGPLQEAQAMSEVLGAPFSPSAPDDRLWSPVAAHGVAAAASKAVVVWACGKDDRAIGRQIGLGALVISLSVLPYCWDEIRETLAWLQESLTSPGSRPLSSRPEVARAAWGWSTEEVDEHSAVGSASRSLKGYIDAVPAPLRGVELSRIVHFHLNRWGIIGAQERVVLASLASLSPDEGLSPSLPPAHPFRRRRHTATPSRSADADPWLLGQELVQLAVKGPQQRTDLYSGTAGILWMNQAYGQRTGRWPLTDEQRAQLVDRLEAAQSRIGLNGSFGPALIRGTGLAVGLSGDWLSGAGGLLPHLKALGLPTEAAEGACEESLETHPELGVELVRNGALWGMGLAHGAAGAVAGLLRVGAKPKVCERVVQALLRTAHWNGEYANWPAVINDGGTPVDRSILLQVCHGAPGVILALSPIPVGADGDLDRLLLAAGKLIRDSGPVRKAVSLCHGSIGSAYALLALYSRTGDCSWLDAARKFAYAAVAMRHRGPLIQTRPSYALWTGWGALPLLLVDLELKVLEVPLLDDPQTAVALRGLAQ